MNFTNPLRTLGIYPEMLENLREAQIKKLIESQYRSLQKTFHPDAGINSPEMSQNLGEAHDLLDSLDNSEFNQVIEDFKNEKKPKASSRDLERLISKAEMSSSEVSRSFSNYIKSQVLGPKQNILNLRNAVFHMEDIHRLMSTVGDVKCSPEEYAERLTKDSIYRIEVDGGGKLTKIKGEKSISLPDSRLVGVLKDRRFAEDYAHALNLDLVKNTEIAFGFKGLEQGMGDYKFIHNIALNPITEDDSLGFLPHLDTEFSEGAYLISANSPGRGCYFNFEGKILSYELLDS